MQEEFISTVCQHICKTFTICSLNSPQSISNLRGKVIASPYQSAFMYQHRNLFRGSRPFRDLFSAVSKSMFVSKHLFSNTLSSSTRLPKIYNVSHILRCFMAVAICFAKSILIPLNSHQETYFTNMEHSPHLQKTGHAFIQFYNISETLIRMMSTPLIFKDVQKRNCHEMKFERPHYEKIDVSEKPSKNQYNF